MIVLGNFTLDPSFCIHLRALITSSDLRRLYALDFFFDKEESKTHLIEILLSPSTKIFCKRIYFFIIKLFFINTMFIN